MSPNPFGNPSSKKDRASCKRLFYRASRLREAAESLEHRVPKSWMAYARAIWI